MAVHKSGKKWGLIAIIAGGTLIVGGLAWKLLTPKKPQSPANPSNGGKTPTNPSNTTTPNTTSNSTSSNTVYASGYPIQMGSRGSVVKDLQNALVGLGHPLVIDGIFGVKTQAALIAETGLDFVQSPADLQMLQGEAANQGTGVLLAPPACVITNEITSTLGG